MWIVVAAVALVAVVAAVATVVRRPMGDDLTSVRSYHSALGTLEHLADRSGPPPAEVDATPDRPSEPSAPLRSYRRSAGMSDRARTAGVTGAAGAAGNGDDLQPRSGATRSVPPVPVRGNDDFPDPEIPLIFDDSRPRDRFRRDASGDGTPVVRLARAQRQALDSMNHRPRRVTTVMIVVAALVLFGVLAYVGSKRSNTTHHAAAATSSTRAGSTSSTHPPATTAANHQGGHSTGSKQKTKPTPTTVPTQIVALTSTSTTATYPVSTNAYRITVTATGPCWVAATTSSTGSTLWAGTLQAGSTQVIQASGIVTVQLGTPSASLALDRVPVVFPTPLRSPFVATFQPTGAAAVAGSSGSTGATATTATTTSTTSTIASSSTTSATTPP